MRSPPMGSDAHYPEEAPAHRVTVEGFWMDATTVTNSAFRRFVEATGYATIHTRRQRKRSCHGRPSRVAHFLRAERLFPRPPRRPRPRNRRFLHRHIGFRYVSRM